MTVTVRVYKDVPGFSGLYKWDYEITNNSINSIHGDDAVNGVGYFDFYTGNQINDLANLTPADNWSSYTATTDYGTYVSVTSGMGPDPNPLTFGEYQHIYALQPGQTMHFSFTTFPRGVKTLDACQFSADGGLADIVNCAWATKAAWGVAGFLARSASSGIKLWANSLRPRTAGCGDYTAGELAVPGDHAVAKLTEFGWSSTDRQELYQSSTLVPNGSKINNDDPVWADPNGNDTPTTNNPAAFAGGFSSALKNVKLKTADEQFAGTATVKIDVAPADFAFSNATAVFSNGTTTIQSIQMSADFPNVIKSARYKFTWSIKFGDGDFQPFDSTSHTIYFLHDIINNDAADYPVSTARLDYVIGIAHDMPADKSGLESAVSALSDSLLNSSPGFGGGHINPPQDNPWATLDNPNGGVDCVSLAVIGALELQQLGYSTANAKKAYPTGAIPSGDTDATSQETQTITGDAYSLSFFNGNYFEGYIRVLSPDADGPRAFTVSPKSETLLDSTGCTVSPASTENLLAFHVITNTYKLLGVSFQEWYWDVDRNLGTPPLNPTLPDHIDLPRNNCPPSESNND